MQPLKILAYGLGAAPISAFLLTLLLTDGAPLKSPPPGEESGPVAATRVMPPAAQGRPDTERQATIAAAGSQSAAQRTIEDPGETAPPPAHTVNPGRDAQLFISLFGVQPASLPPSR